MQNFRFPRRRSLFHRSPQRDFARPRSGLYAIWAWFWRGLRCAATLIGVLVLLSLAAMVLSLAVFRRPAPPRALPDKIVLYTHLDGAYADTPFEADLADPFAPYRPSLSEVIATLNRAAGDPRVKGLYADMEAGDYSLAQAQELRPVLARFKKAGKFAYIYASSYGDGGSGLAQFSLASQFDQRWLEPMGVVSIAGVRAEVPFIGGVLDRAGIEPQFFKRKNYKTVFESAGHEMSPESREELNAVIGDIKASVLGDLPKDLAMTPAAFETLVEKGLFTAQEALQAKLITHADYADVLDRAIKKAVTGDEAAEDDALYVDMTDYAYEEHTESPAHEGKIFTKPRPRVALLFASGLITETQEGGAGAGNILADGVIASQSLVPIIDDLAKDEDVKAIVLRLDSPGGSPVASEDILRALKNAAGKDKKIIVSMGRAAASGGYWIATAADRIFALPATLTGSIGVAGGKISVQDMWSKLGVHWEHVSWGQNAGLWSINQPYNPSETERMNAMMDQIYDAFTARVAEGRHMKPDQVEKVAQGRVWTGASAVKNGLVDEIGGLEAALDYTARILKAKDANDLDIEILPKPETMLEKLKALAEGGMGGMVFQGMKLKSSVLAAFAPYIDAALVFGDGAVAVYEPAVLR